MYSALLFLLITTFMFVICLNAIILGIILYCTALAAKAHAYLTFEDKKSKTYSKHVKLTISNYIVVAIMYAVGPVVINWATLDFIAISWVKAYVLLLALMAVVWLISWAMNYHKAEKAKQYKHNHLLYNHVKVPRVKNRDRILLKRTKHMPYHFQKRGDD